MEVVVSYLVLLLFAGIAMDLVPPRDRWNLIYLTLVLHGLGTLTAWNMFITATVSDNLWQYNKYC